MSTDYTPKCSYVAAPCAQSLPSKPVTREDVLRLEGEINKLPQVDCPVRHFFAPGIYAREMTIPAGVVLTGAVHRHEHLCTVAKGRIAVSTDEGMKELAAGATLVSLPGAKRVGYAIEETVWVTYHPNPTNERDIDKLLADIIEDDPAALMGGSRNVQHAMNQADADRADYARFLAEYGLTQAIVTRLVENAADQIPMPDGVDALELRESLIEGRGMFATRDLGAGEVIAPARIRDKRTPAGRHINHSSRANAAFFSLPDGGLEARATRAIEAGEEVTVDYRQAMRVNGAGFKPLGEQE
ncbi:SET domain-containing protein-lysine N-methyltransferase [Paraburkholderia rhynchosiae]|uniref:SET domain-containing protein-lysine N-methyltransferase n=1 Tax=Paraburkholderia rhynchosiae TaxID=487049 RepID=A0ACC7N371_9BURK